MIREDTLTVVPMTTETFSPIRVTAAAADKLREVMTAKGLDGAALRVFVRGGGCSGLQYGLAFETDGGEADDNVFESGGLTVIVDPVSIAYVQGADIDYVDSLMGGGFKIENPNAAASCGCGHSFKPAGAAAASGASGGGGCCSGH